MRGTGDRCNSKGIGFSSLVTGNDLKFQTNSYQSTKGNVLKVKTQLTYNNAYFNLQLVFITTQRTCKDVYLQVQVTTRQNHVLTTQLTYSNVHLQVTTRQNNVLTTQLTYNNVYLQVTTRQNNVLTTQLTYNNVYLQVTTRQNNVGGGGGLQPKKTERYRKFQIWDWFFRFLASFDWFNGFLLSGSFWY